MSWKNKKTNKAGTKDYDYRSAYFKKHKGFFGWYICGICGLPVHKNNCHIDHILPKSKSQFLLNRDFNLQIAHPGCNLKKSDKIDHRVATGFARKWFGGIFGTILSIPITIITFIMTSILGLGSATVSGITTLLGNIISRFFQVLGDLIKGTLGLFMNLVVRNIPILIAVVVIGFLLLGR